MDRTRSEPEWRAAEKKAFEEGPKTWYPLIVPLPGLLERADEYLATPSLAQEHPDALRALCDEFAAFETPLLAWVEARLTDSPRKVGQRATNSLQ